MRVTVLGCGTSSGVPLIGCRCPVCTSDEPRNRRRRCAILIDQGATRVLVDTPPDLRCQCLDAGVDRLDAILYTHAHADHVNGIDDVRALNFLMDRPIDAYARCRGPGAHPRALRLRLPAARAGQGLVAPGAQPGPDRGPVHDRRAARSAPSSSATAACRAGVSGSAASPTRPTSTACPRRRWRSSPGSTSGWSTVCASGRTRATPISSRRSPGSPRSSPGVPS